MDSGGVICIGPASGVALAMVFHFLAVRRGYRLRLHTFALITFSFIALAWSVNRAAPDREMAGLTREILDGSMCAGSGRSCRQGRGTVLR